MVVLLIIVAVLAGIVGFFLLSQATMGVGVVGLACLAGILARIAQASGHQQEVMKAIAGSAMEGEPGAS